ncbi:MAG: amidohydrolase [Anaerolineaceae bacterium]|nr:amidohydrolase [Anaerolineaceae bacterium]|tara:strand:- start:65 stop:904 length:840 start_codon:yes stop_codon:yes gene_type:complete
MKIVDSHVHFWDIELLEYNWLLEEPTIRRTYLPSDFLQETKFCDIDKLLFVQADCLPSEGLDEVEWVKELASVENRIAGIVAFAPIENHASLESNLDRLAGIDLVRGVRRILQSESNGFATQESFIDGVLKLEEFGFTFDVCVNHTQLPDVVELVDRCPNVNFVLDHLGKPDIKNKRFCGWKDHISDLSAYPNIYCKLSGMATEADRGSWTIADFVPYIEHTLESFGIDRVMFGGDWPVATLATTYEGWFEALLACLSHLSASELDCVFQKNAEKFYRI